MRSRRERAFLWFFAVWWTLFVVGFDVGSLVAFARLLQAGGTLRGSDLFVALFLLPFHLNAVNLWLKVFRDRVPPAWSAALRARRRPLQTAAVFTTAAFVVAMAIAFTTPHASLLLAMASWLGVLGAGIVGYSLSPRFDWLRRRANDQPRVPLPPLPVRQRASRSITDSRRISTVDSKPMRMTVLGLLNTELVPRGESCFLARPRWHERLGVGILGIGFSGAWLGAGSLLLANRAGPSLLENAFWLALVGLGCLAGVWVVLIALCHDGNVVFDLQQDELTYGQRWMRRTRPLADVVAVQFLMIAPPHIRKFRSSDTERRCRFQINLVLADPIERRIQVLSHPNSRWSHDAARQLARALQIPLIDQVFSPDPGERPASVLSEQDCL